jgi:hypothetical protein
MPGWNSQAAAARKLQESIKRLDQRPDQKTIERRIKGWLEEHDQRGT